MLSCLISPAGVSLSVLAGDQGNSLRAIHDLLCADEVFETGSLAELKPICSVGGRIIASGAPGQVTRTLHAAVRGLMEGGTAGTPP